MRFKSRIGVLVLVSLSCSLPLSAQVQVADSLRLLLNDIKNSGNPDTVFISTLNEYVYSLQYLNPDSALILGEQSRDKSRAIGFKSGYMEATRNVGIVYYLKGNFVKAFEYFLDALSVAEALGNKKGIARIHNNIGLIYHGQAKYNEALASQLKSLAIKKEINDKPGIATSYNNIANIYKNLDNYEESLRYHKLALEAKQVLGDQRSIAASLNNIGWLYLKQSAFKKAIEYFNEAEPLAQNVRDKILISDVEQGLAECYNAFENYNAAIKHAEVALSVAESINLKDQQRDCNETLSKIYKAQGKFEKALFHYEQYKTFADSINNSEIEKRTASLSAQFEFDKKEAILTADQARLNALHEKDNLQLKWMIATSLIALFSVSFMAFQFYRGRNKLKIAYKKLAEATQEINLKSEALRDINITLIKQKQELVEQKDLVTLQNEKLQAISSSLELHKENLEYEVEKRTRELEDYATRMEQFAFFTAHDLRAPVATILGLANLLNLYRDNPEEKQVIFEKLIYTTRKLDGVVKQLNQSIDYRKTPTEMVAVS